MEVCGLLLSVLMFELLDNSVLTFIGHVIKLIDIFVFLSYVLSLFYLAVV